MIGRREPPKTVEETAPQKGFDDFELRLGDIMRGERATMGKSLLDVQRELRIKASFIAAIENADISHFATPGFVAGYVRSYARYLDLDPDWAFQTFCREANFVSASTRDQLSKPQGPAPTEPVFRKKPAPEKPGGYDPFADPRVAFAPKPSRHLANINPRAIGSMLVLLALTGGVGYGGWSVLQEIQRVQVTPVDRAPTATASIDPLAEMQRPAPLEDTMLAANDPAQSEILDRLYRPQTLDVPVMVPRDGPIAALDPRTVGVLAEVAATQAQTVAAGPRSAVGPVGPGATSDDPIAAAIAMALSGESQTPKVTVDAPEVMLVAVRPAWVRVRAADGSVLLEKILNPGETYVVPQTDAPPILRTGAAGAMFFSVNGQTYGPAGGDGQVVDKIALDPAALSERFAMADPTAGGDAEKAVAMAQAVLAPEPMPTTEPPAAD